MNEWISIIISCLALIISALTAWLTLLRRGSLRMTQPTVVFFGPDGGPSSGGESRTKVFLRTLLYSTSERGQVVEGMHINVRRGEMSQNFNIWVYGNERLARGSGIYVGHEGVVCNHHFLLPRDSVDFKLFPGTYTIRVFAKVVGERKIRQLTQLILTISDGHAKQLEDLDAGIYFDWGPDSATYHAHIDRRPELTYPVAKDAEEIFSAIRTLSQPSEK